MSAPTSTRESAATTTATGTTTAGVAPRPRPAHAGRPADERRSSSYRHRPFGLRLRLRPRTVRARIVSLLMVPVVSLLALWGFATVTTAQQIDSLMRLKHVDETLLQPIDSTVSALQAERTAALAYLAAPDQSRLDAYDGKSRATDAAVSAMSQDILRGEPDAAGLATTLPGRIDALNAATGSLRHLRSRIEARQVGWSDAATAYTGVVDSGFGVVGSLTGVQNGDVASDARVLLELSQAREMLAREDAAVQAGQAAGRMSAEQYQEFTGARYARRALETTAAPDLRPADLAAYQQVTNGQQGHTLAQLEDAIRGSEGGGKAVSAAGSDWVPTASAVRQQLDGVLTAAGTDAGANSDPYSLGVLTKNGAAVLFGLLAVLLSLLISVRIGRGLVVELVELRNSALELAGRRLPDAMRRLRAGEEIDIEAEAPVVEAGDDEIGQVGEALNTVQRAALTAAVERAEVLSGVSGVFVNLARRSQVLVHRQLTLLDAMERRTEDPAELEDLFRLDHLTTRMRRHAEGLIILSGAAPGRAWRKPVPLLDVVRSAVAEVEDYSRVDVRRLPGVSVVGAAVADLTHLLAELVENATAFSPPHTKVLVAGEQVGAGYAVEIEDRGLGMGKEAIAEANRRIADAQQADLFDSDRLGLFVVSRLARRHGVRVSLRPSAYGGTTAVVLLPSALLETARQRRRAPLDAEMDLPPVQPSGSAPGASEPTGPDGPAAPHRDAAAAPGPFAQDPPPAFGRPVPPSGGFPRQAGHQGPAAAPASGEPGAGPHGVPGAAPSSAGIGGGDREAVGRDPDRPLPFGRRGGFGEPVPFGAQAVGAGDGRPDAGPAAPGGEDGGFAASGDRPAGVPLPFGRPVVTPGSGNAAGASPAASNRNGTAGDGDSDEQLPARRGGSSPFGRGGGRKGTLQPGQKRHPPFGRPGGAGADDTGTAAWPRPSGGADGFGGGAPDGGTSQPEAGGESGWPTPFDRADTAGGSGPDTAHEGEELPRRVRQASLAVQLREAPPEPPRSGRVAPEASERSPEQARATMAALRDGWTRGRNQGQGGGGFGGDVAGGAGRRLRLHQGPSDAAQPRDAQPHDAQPHDDSEDFERSAADGRDDESHR